MVFLLTKTMTTWIISLMETWIAFAAFHLIFSWIIILSYHPQKVKAIADKEDTSSPVIFLFVVMAAFISLFAVIFLLQSIPNISKRGLSFHILLAIASVFCSWTLIHTLFTLRYAHLYYTVKEQNIYDNIHKNDKKEDIEGLDFPDEKNPDYLDFAYFSFVIGMTFQVSDVQITSRKIRRLVLLHALLSFVYNTVIVALSINIISGIISK